MNPTRFRNWLVRELEDRGWSQGELSRRSTVSYSLVSKVCSGEQNPSFFFCNGIASSLGRTPTELFLLAGLISEKGAGYDRAWLAQVKNVDTSAVELHSDMSFQQLLDAIRNLGPEARREVLSFALWQKDRLK